MAAQNDNAGFVVVPVSPLSRDDEVHIPFSMRMMSPGFRPEIGQYLADIRFDPTIKKNLSAWKDLILCKITGGSAGSATLIFSQFIKPSAALFKTPSLTLNNWKPHQWEAVIRGQPIWHHMLDADNYLGTLTDIEDREIEETTEITQFRTRIWWTSEPWSLAQRYFQNATPGPVAWNYPGAKGKRVALHGDLIMPSLVGVQYINGQATRRLNIPEKHIKRTNFITWTEKVVSDDEEYINGRYKRSLTDVIPPYDPLKFPPTAQDANR